MFRIRSRPPAHKTRPQGEPPRMTPTGEAEEPGAQAQMGAPVPPRRDQGREEGEAQRRTLFFGVIGGLAALAESFAYLYVLFALETTDARQVAGVELPAELMGMPGLFYALGGVALGVLGLCGALLSWVYPRYAALCMFGAAVGLFVVPGPNSGLAVLAMLFLIFGGFHAYPRRENDYPRYRGP